MTDQERIALIDRLRVAADRDRSGSSSSAAGTSPQQLGEYLSALANAAASGRPSRAATLVFGIDDASRTRWSARTFDPYSIEGQGQPGPACHGWTCVGCQPNTGVEPFTSCAHPGGRVVLFEIGPANGSNQSRFYGTPYIRVGASKTELSQAPGEGPGALDARQRLVRGACAKAASLADLDPEADRRRRASSSWSSIRARPTAIAALGRYDTFLNKAKRSETRAR
jgi:hypothetical protein